MMTCGPSCGRNESVRMSEAAERNVDAKLALQKIGGLLPEPKSWHLGRDVGSAMGEGDVGVTRILEHSSARECSRDHRMVFEEGTVVFLASRQARAKAPVPTTSTHVSSPF